MKFSRNIQKAFVWIQDKPCTTTFTKKKKK